MYGSIDKKQMTCRISWVILFCFCDITFLLSQEQGKFVSKKLENIAFRLSSQYQADCSVKQRMCRANLRGTFLGNLVYPTPASKMLHFP